MVFWCKLHQLRILRDVPYFCAQSNKLSWHPSRLANEYLFSRKTVAKPHGKILAESVGVTGGITDIQYLGWQAVLLRDSYF